CRLETTETEDARAISKRPRPRLASFPRSRLVRTRWFGAQYFRPNTHFAGGAPTNTTLRQCPYDPQAFALLKTLFSSWVTLSDAVGPCTVCAALAENSSQDKRELRKKAEEEKVDH